MTPDEYLTNQRPNGGVLYYPGAGTDSGPFRLFAGAAGVATIVYADYMTTRNDAEAFFAQIAGEATVQIEGMKPGDFGAEAWDDFWPNNPASRSHATPDGAFALQARFSAVPGGPPIRFIYLATEAIQTFTILVRARIKPTVVVLQDHGFGCNWDRFGKDGQLWKAAKGTKALPELLLVAENTDSWDGYIQLTEYAPCGGQMHAHSRALFRRSRTAAKGS
ncbi:MAG: hypothetical protein K8T26_11460 [Lentisphaerae bacterium]|nr:hypothetical protein [Lentisphaerota bacterium]